MPHTWRAIISGFVAIATVICALTISAKLVQLQMRATQMLTEERVSIERYMNGTAARPFAHRTLVPLLIHTSEEIVGKNRHYVETIFRRFNSKIIPENVAGNAHILQYYSLFFILFSSLLLYSWFTGESYSRVAGAVSWFRWFPHVFSLIFVVPFVSQGYGHIYDFTVLAIAASSLYFMISENHRMFLLVYLLGCANKETTLSVTLMYGAYFWGTLERRSWILSMAAQVSGFLLVQGIIRFHFQENEGMALESHAGYLLAWATSFSFIDASSLLVFSLVLLRGYWEISPRVRSLMIAFPIFLLLYLLAGHPGEFRAFYDVVPLLLIVLLRGLHVYSDTSKNRVAATS